MPRSLHVGMVRFLELEFSGPSGQEIASLLRHLHLNRCKNMLPNLSSLSITVTDVPHEGLLLNPLLSPNVEWLQLVFETETTQQGNPNDTVVTTFTEVIEAVKGLPLKTLSISSADEDLKSSVAATRAIGELIDSNSNLTRVEVNDFHSRLLSPFIASSQVPYLREAQFSVLSFSSPITNITSLPERQDLQGVLGFTTLGALAIDLACRDTDYILSLASHAPLTSLRLRLEQPGKTIDRSLRIIGQFEGLTSVFLWFPDVRGEWKDLVPLLSCTQLCMVDLHGIGIAGAVGDAEVILMATAWPKLRKLWLRELPGDADGEGTQLDDTSYTPVLTLPGVSKVAELCPEITALAAPIDARPAALRHTATGLGPSVRDLWFPHSILDGNTVQIAQFIADHWPHHVYPSPSPLLGIAEMQDGDPWKDVWVLARARRSFIAPDL